MRVRRTAATPGLGAAGVNSAASIIPSASGGGPVPPPSAYRRYWRRDVLALILLAAAALAWGAFTDGDRLLARLFYDGESPEEPFPGRFLFPWSLLYRAVSWPIIAVVVGALAVLSGSLRSERLARRRRSAMAILLAVALGPGVLVNMILKDHWGRPRPVQIEEFGGRQIYRDAWIRGQPGRGKSFPCGHSSAGYFFTIFFLLARRRHPARARAWLVFAVVYGTLLGWGRMIAGAHFFSDVVWSGIAAHAVNVLVYYFLLNLPGHEDAMAAGVELPAVSWRVYSVYGALAGAALAGALLATPHHRQFDDEILPPDENPPFELLLRIEGDEARLIFSGEEGRTPRAPPARRGVPASRAPQEKNKTPVRLVATYEGFGAFNAGLIADRAVSKAADGAPVIHYRLGPRGWWTEFDMSAEIMVPPSGWASLELEIGAPGGFVEVLSEEPPPHPIRLRIPGGQAKLPKSWAGHPSVRVLLGTEK